MRLLFTLILLLLNTRNASAKNGSGRSETTTPLEDDDKHDQPNLRHTHQELVIRVKAKEKCKKTGAPSSTHYNGDEDEDDAVTIKTVKSATVIPPNGGTIALPDHGFVDFPSGAFAISGDTTVSIQTTNDVAATELFNEYAKLFHVSAEASFMISMEIDSPLKSSALAPVAVLFIPQELIEKTPLGSKIEVFGKTIESGNLGPDDLQYDMFVNLPSKIVESGPSGMAIVFALYPALFQPRNENGETTYEAIFKLAATTGTDPASGESLRNRRTLEDCNLDNEGILAPVDGTVEGCGPQRSLILQYEGDHSLLPQLWARSRETS